MVKGLTAAAVACMLATGAVGQSLLTGLVVGITDGDTLTLLDDSKQQHRIRLDGIDAPESGQPFGSRSKQSLADLGSATDNGSTVQGGARKCR